MGLFPALVPGMPAPAMAACRGGAIMPPFTGAGNHDGAPGRTHHGYEPRCRRGWRAKSRAQASWKSFW
ncbi:hypothetical protein C3920_00945 [Novacetimonas pomaceti]|uniref:Uncharacterized protein n=1 Tax=Novacetimonas pomaceti TaxID=2021998 RepID=A0ABX5P5U2_9PROT|nr:hypothetical protein C3920_00945 [Novacetimonas pomaceti]